MAIDDIIYVNWASYIFEGMLESIKKTQTRIGVPQYGLLISYILEKKMPLVDIGEHLANSDSVPPQNTRGRTKINRLSRNPQRLPTIALGVTERLNKPVITHMITTLLPSESEVESQQNEEEDDLFTEMHQVLEAERNKDLSRNNKRQLNHRQSMALQAKSAQPPPKRKLSHRSRGSHSAISKRTGHSIHRSRGLHSITAKRTDQSVQSLDFLNREVNEYADVTSVPYHPWDTRTDPFSKLPCQNIDTIIPSVGLPHTDLVLRRIRNWCLPLCAGDHGSDLITMADSLIKEFEEAARCLIVELEDDLFSSDANEVTRTTHDEAVRFFLASFLQF